MVSFNNRNKFVCKSDITRELLTSMCVPNYITVDMAKDVIRGLPVDGKFVKVEEVGHSYDKKKRKHVKFVHKHYLYKKLINN